MYLIPILLPTLPLWKKALNYSTVLSRHLKGDKTVKLAILTSCCPGWVNFFEHSFLDMLEIPSTARSPQQMFGAIAKTYFADKIGVKREDMVVVSIMPCLAKEIRMSA